MSDEVNLENDPTPEVSALIREPALEQVLSELSNNLQVKMQAYQLFLGTNQTPEEIGLNLSLPAFIVKHWIAAEEWGKRKAVWMAQEFRRREIELQSFRSDHALEEAKRQLESAGLIEEEIKDVMEILRRERLQRGPNDPALPRNYDMTLNRLSQALKNATDITSRIVGIDTTPKLSEAETAKTIIMIGGKPAQGVRLSDKGNKSQVIDIE